jgi:ubiquinone/menaquinone biosynthesis C-methylase UbiE
MPLKSPFQDSQFIARYLSLRQQEGNPTEPLDKRTIRALLPALSGRSVLDLGCGWGDFCRYAAANGAAKVVGIDFSEGMLEAAHKHTHQSNIKYILDDIEDVVLPAQEFDLVHSDLTIHYISDLSALLRRIHKTLTPGGRFIFSVEHPIKTAQDDGWILDSKGLKQAWRLDAYGQEGARATKWLEFPITKYHRKVETYLSALLEVSFRVTAVKEPQPTSDDLARLPSMQYETARPPFLIVAASSS